MVKVSVIIPNYNGEKFLTDCLNALKKQRFTDFDTILVDNGSTDNSIKTSKNVCPDIKIIELKENTGFAKAVNEGIKAAEGEFVILLNNDTIAFPGFVGNQYSMIKNKPDVFSCSALMIQNHDHNKVDDAGDEYCALGWAFALGKDKEVKNYLIPHEVFAACGGAAIYRTRVLKELGMFDEKFFAYLEDIDLAYRAKLHGYKNIYNPHARVYHVGSGSSGSRYNEFKIRLAARNSMYLIRKNMPVWQLWLNAPFIIFGVMVKMAFFTKKGYPDTYVKAIKEGLSDKNIKKNSKTNDVKMCIKMQKELYKGLYLFIKNKLS